MSQATSSSNGKTHGETSPIYLPHLLVPALEHRGQEVDLYHRYVGGLSAGLGVIVDVHPVPDVVNPLDEDKKYRRHQVAGGCGDHEGDVDKERREAHAQLHHVGAPDRQPHELQSRDGEGKKGRGHSEKSGACGMESKRYVKPASLL